ncbi:hypothetical protein B0H11DRAFT_1745484, partial [Mycena galericulata]
YHPWDNETLADMRASHESVGREAKAQRRSSSTQTTGEMRLMGSRMGTGAGKGDGYRPYAHSNGTPEGATAFFAHARDADTMSETVRGFAPGVIRDIRETVTAAGVNRMGKMGMNAFYCWEYGAPLHRDRDATWSLCCQLWKTKGHDEAYNFAYAEWGCYIVTVENCVWYAFFNPKELHGTVLPADSERDIVISRGTHTTVRNVDCQRAALYEQIRLTYSSRVAYWASVST